MDDYSQLMVAFERLMLTASVFADQHETEANAMLDDALRDAVCAWCAIENAPREYSVDELLVVLSKKHEQAGTSSKES